MSAPESAPAEWSLARRVAFRFAVVLFLLLNFPFPLNLLPRSDRFFGWWEKSWAWLDRACAVHVLHLSKPLQIGPNGSGDTTADYVNLLCVVALSLLAAGLWSWLDRRRPEYRRLWGWLRVYLRYVLAAAMLGYGLNKVFKLQFPFPNAARLTETYGESSPMGLAWAFMGYSTGYTVFAGALETMGGLLLLFRRTATLGALLVAGVMLNVVMMNFCYDIPVKLYSTQLLLTALLVMGPSMGRLLDLLVFHRPVQPEDIRPPQLEGWRRWARRGLKAAMVLGLLFINLRDSWQELKQYGALAPKGPLEGLYETEAFSRAGAEVPPLATDGSRWRRVIVGQSFLRVQGMDDARKSFSFEADEAKASLVFYDASKPAEGPRPPEGSFHVSRPDPAHLLLQGSLDGAPVEIRLRKVDPQSFLLVNRGFHWINERPFNR